MHLRCYPVYASSQPWYRKPGWPTNRWRSLLMFNTVFMAIIAPLLAIGEHVVMDNWKGIAGAVLIANGWLMAGRAVSYFSIERHLPKR